ncbi:MULTISPECIES: DUF998 domain-containing protein [unclassified Rhodococcus (in: high G+C Gram-positive bacteria)]|uniref:DUF998 domain-containing protein n=1 Tax=unclassified Rhodococcus (in: high G+C Gram-positive bacteria) TaxID=192944 RepID=UPI0007BBB43D|nr:MULTISPECIES: DUF998 domain-containing protein [unclassified Rhodococcus (in: high G+C Gram-positive bacteria)]KZF02965.1 hypothetical protein A2J04_06760 [Rhodococcus sp. EPR-279]KZF09933.1 hypothetical protein A2J02_17790 [Rhodococcus sp. EPR-147]
MTNIRSRVLIGVGLVAAFLYANFLIDWVQRGFRGMGEVVSELEAPGEPNAMLLRVTDVVCAVLVVALLPSVRSALPSGRWREVAVWATALFALGSVVAAVVPVPCGPSVTCSSPSDQLQLQIHDGASVVSNVALFAGVAAVWFATRDTGPRWLKRLAWWSFWIVGVVASLVFGYFDGATEPSSAVGVSQRIHIVGISAWIVCLGVVAARGRP